MKSKSYFYSLIPLFLLIISVVLVSCGGSDSTGVIPGNISQAPSVQLVSKEVSGYIFATNGLTSSQAGEEVSQRFVILDVPLSGEDAFLSQVSSTLQEEHPEDWSNPKMQELFNKLSAELSGWQPLSAINGAQLFTVYQDSRSENPLTVGEDGFFEGAVMVASTDDLVKFEVVIGQEDCYAVETIASSDMTASEGDSPSLSSCPEIILNFPGWCTIFKVKASPVINLKEAGLTFTLSDSSMGCITENPIYLRCRGSRKYNVGYGIFYANPGLTTPIDTTITASTTTGLTLSIFTEVIGSSASIRGHVGGAGVVPVFGFVYSFGCRAFDCLDEAGDYHLSSVFQGHNRKVVAIYWLVQPDGAWKKYREERVINFFDGNLTGFDLPETVQPTPTSFPLTEEFYSHTAKRVLMQKEKWAEELGMEMAVQKSVQWLNGEISIYPVPEGIAHARVADDPVDMWIIFTDGIKRKITSHPFVVDDTITSLNFEQKPINNLQIKSSKATTVGSDKVVILAPFAWQSYTKETSVYYAIWNKLVAAGYQERGSKCKATTLEDIVYEKKNEEEEATRIIAIADRQETLVIVNDVLREKNLPGLIEVQEDKLIDLKNYECEDSGELGEALNKNFDSSRFSDEQVEAIWDIEEIMVPIKNYDVTCSIKNLSHMENIITPEDFQDLSDYGVIYIATHGFEDGITLCPMYTNASFLDPNKPDSWFIRNKGTGIYDVSKAPFLERSNPEVRGTIDVISLNENFFAGQDFSKSLIFLAACESFNFLEESSNPLHDAKIYLGFTKEVEGHWNRDISYYFFLYMIEGYAKPSRLFPNNAQGSISEPNPLPPPGPMSVQKALDTFSKVTWGDDKKANPDPHDYSNREICENCQDCELKLKPPGNSTEEIYFPAPVTIIVEKDK